MKATDQDIAAISRAMAEGNQELFESAFTALVEHLEAGLKPPSIRCDMFPLRKIAGRDKPEYPTWIGCHWPNCALMISDPNNSNSRWELVLYEDQRRVKSFLCV